MYHHNTFTDILEDSYQLVKYFQDFPIWEYRIAKLFIKGSNSALPEREIQEMFYYLTDSNPPKYLYQWLQWKILYLAYSENTIPSSLLKVK